MKKRIAKVLIVGCLLCQSAGTLQAQTLLIDGKKVEYQLSPISLYVNKKPVKTTVMDPIQLNNRVLVPSREVFEAMGAKVGWNNTQKQVTVQYKNKNIILIVNQTEAMIDGKKVSMDVPAKIINDKVMIPVRFVSEAMGMTVTWDAANRSVWIEEPVIQDVKKEVQVKQVSTKETSTQFLVTINASAPMKDVKVSTLTDKVIIDISESKSLLNQSISPVENTYVKGIRTSQFTADTTRIVLDLKVAVEVKTSFTNDRTGFNVTLTKLKNDSQTPNGPTTPGNGGTIDNGTNNGGSVTEEKLYVPGTKPTLNLSGASANKIKVTDDYRNKTLVFDLGADYSKNLPNTVLKPNDTNIASITVNTSGTTKVTVVTKKIYTYQCTQGNKGAVVQFVKPREQYKQIVVLDIGHGGTDAGAVGNGLTEKEINYNQGMALYKLLEADPNIKVYMTRETDVYPTLQFRAQLANEIEADLFVSLHNNSAASNVTGTETLYFPSSTDPRSKQIASLVQKNIIDYCGTVDRGIKPRSDLYVLKATNMPAILIETGFISNPTEAQLINSAAFIQKWSQGVYDAIVEGFKYLSR